MAIDPQVLLDVNRRIKKEKLNTQQIVELLKTPNRLLDLRDTVDILNDHIWDLHSKKVKMEKEIEEKRKRLLTL